jgi:glycosyltransferase involved in cell wall biosynthesis
MPSTPTVFYVRDDASEKKLRSYMPDTLTVIMPAFNAAGTIEESVRSVMAQTYKEWVLLVIDDGSTDDTLQICERLAAEDPRIIPVAVSHRGLCAVLNLGLRVSRGQLIARMDADDLSYPTRFSKQVEFLAAHPSVKVLGTWGDHVNDAGRSVQKLRTGPINRVDLEQQRQAREGVALVHTSVMAHREILLAFGGYNDEDYPAEDLWLWSKIAQQHDVMALAEDLVGYRIMLRA